MNTIQTPKKSAIEAKAIIDQMVKTSGLTIQQLSEVNGCNCGYELMKKIIAS